MKLLSHSEPNPLLFLQTWFRKPAGVSPIHHTLLVSSQRTEECVWPGCRNHQPPLAQEQLLRDPKEAGASRRSSSNGKTCKVIPLAPFPSACPLAYFCFSSSSRPHLNENFILQSEQRPFLWAVRYPTQELYAPCSAQDPLVSKWLNFPHWNLDKKCWKSCWNNQRHL